MNKLTGEKLTTAQKSAATIASEKNFILNYLSLCMIARQKLSNFVEIRQALYILIDFDMFTLFSN